MDYVYHVIEKFATGTWLFPPFWTMSASVMLFIPLLLLQILAFVAMLYAYRHVVDRFSKWTIIVLSVFAANFQASNTTSLCWFRSFDTLVGFGYSENFAFWISLTFGAVMAVLLTVITFAIARFIANTVSARTTSTASVTAD